VQHNNKKDVIELKQATRIVYTKADHNYVCRFMSNVSVNYFPKHVAVYVGK